MTSGTSGRSSGRFRGIHLGRDCNTLVTLRAGAGAEAEAAEAGAWDGMILGLDGCVSFGFQGPLPDVPGSFDLRTSISGSISISISI